TLGDGTEKVSTIAAHLPLVYNTRQASGPRQHAEKRRFREAHRGVPVVDEENLIAGQREFVSTARADAVDGREELEARVLACIFNGEAGLVGELVKISLPSAG